MFIPLLSNISARLQEKSTARRAAMALHGLGYAPVSVRRALIALHNVSIKKLERPGLCSSTLYNTLYGRTANPAARGVIAKALGVPVDLLFPNGAGRASDAGPIPPQGVRTPSDCTQDTSIPAGVSITKGEKK